MWAEAPIEKHCERLAQDADGNEPVVRIGEHFYTLVSDVVNRKNRSGGVLPHSDALSREDLE